MSDDKNLKAQARKIIDKSPKLKALKSHSEGEKSLFHSTSWHGGKGSAPRQGTHTQEYKDNFDKIDFSKKSKRTYKLKINGVYVEDEHNED